MLLSTQNTSAALRRFCTPLFLCAAAGLAGAQSTYYVDDDHPGDPSPGVSGLGFPFSNPSETGASALPFDDIQKAIDAASNGDTVIVRPSNYFGYYSLDTTFGPLDFKGKAITVKSEGGAAVTAIDGSTLPGQAGLLFDSGEGAGTVLEGFTIQNCDNGFVSGDSGGGLYISNASPTIRDCVITDNHAYLGAGLYISNSNSMIEDCVFFGNTAVHQGGGTYTNDGTPNFVRCTFESNTARYGAGFLSRTDGSTHVTVSECTFIGNSNAQFDSYGGGLAKFDGGGITIDRSLFIGNSTTNAGGALRLQGGSLVTNTIINSNTSSSGEGGGVYVDGTGGTNLLRGVTITNNTGGGVLEGSGIIVTQLRNSIVWDNSLFEVGINVSVAFSNILGGYGGAGNLDIDPMFRDVFGPDGVRGTLDDDLSLRGKSRCIDAGETTLLSEVEYPVDYAGNPRVVNHPKADIGISLVGYSVDIGALEFQYQPDCNRVVNLQSYP